ATVGITGSGSSAVANPTGVVTFSEGGTSIGQGTLSTSGGTTTASFSTSNLPVGNDPITASYGGDNNFLPTPNMLIQAIALAQTNTLLQVSASTPTFGQPVTLTATVSSETSDMVMGTVTFLDADTPLVTVPVSGGTATFSTAALSLGDHSLSAA